MNLDQWPTRSDTAAWEALAARALQEATFAADIEENAAWEATMRELLAQGLGYEEFVNARLEALRKRIRTRKLTQQNLRYQYGFRHRSASLVRLDIQRWFRAHPPTDWPE